MTHKKIAIPLVVFSLSILQDHSMGEGNSDVRDFLPASIHNWKLAEKDKVYDRETLFEYIDGGAELYLTFGFRKLFSRTYSRSGQPDIIVDLFDMGSSKDAFGVFTLSSESPDDVVGQGSQCTQGLLLFWKSNYYVSILASPETTESKRALIQLANMIDAAIEEEGTLPEIVGYLPKDSLIEGSIKYFHHHIWLNTYYFVSDENILLMDENTDAILAKYGNNDKRLILLIVRYRSEGDSKRSYHNFVKHYLPEMSGKSVVRIEDGTWTTCQLLKNMIIMIFDAATEDIALEFMRAFRQELPIYYQD